MLELLAWLIALALDALKGRKYDDAADAAPRS